MSPRKVSVGQREDIFLVEDFLSPQECHAFINLSEGRGFEEAAISTAAGQVVVKEVRNNDRLIWDDIELAKSWWSRARDFFPASFGRWQASGLNERFRFYRYQPGQKFSAHRDGAFERSRNEMSWMTLMVYLNEGYEGGCTRFDLASEPEPIVIEPRQGMALAFMHDRVHEGEELRSGAKYVLRTDVMYRRS